ncbi:MAG: hypothetical protein AAGF60_04805 [Pseudomonadota bacterium]
MLGRFVMSYARSKAGRADGVFFGWASVVLVGPICLWLSGFAGWAAVNLALNVGLVGFLLAPHWAARRAPAAHAARRGGAGAGRMS